VNPGTPNSVQECVDNRMGFCFFNVFEETQKLICTDEATDKLRSKKHCCCTNSLGAGWKSEGSEKDCELCPLANEPEYEKLCSDTGAETGGEGFLPEGLRPQIDQCKEFENFLCKPYGKCVNDSSDRGYHCECPVGYEPVENEKGFLVCEDINECLIPDENGDLPCDTIGTNNKCVNHNGNYECLCDQPNFIPQNNNGVASCLDNAPGKCSGELSPTCDANVFLPTDKNLPKQQCCCGQIGKAFNCEHCPICGTPEWDELCDGVQLSNICNRDSNICKGGRCSLVNPDAQCPEITCNCPKGYHEDNFECVDINECDNPNTCPGENTVCKNYEGGATCLCKPGYTQVDGKCVDIDECSRPGACHNGECSNSEGSFHCECNPGFKPSSTGTSSQCAIFRRPPAETHTTLFEEATI